MEIYVHTSSGCVKWDGNCDNVLENKNSRGALPKLNKSGAEPKKNTESKEGGERSTHGSSQCRDDLLIHKWIKQRAAVYTAPYLVAGHRCTVAGRSRNRAEGHHSQDGKLIYCAAHRQKRTFWASCSSSDFKNKNKTRCYIDQVFRSCDT